MLAHKLRDDERIDLINNIDKILGKNTKHREIIIEKCEKFHTEHKNLLNNNDFNLNIGGFNFQSENEVKYNKLLEKFIEKQIAALERNDNNE